MQGVLPTACELGNGNLYTRIYFNTSGSGGTAEVVGYRRNCLLIRSCYRTWVRFLLGLITKQRIFVPKRTVNRVVSSGSYIYYVTWMRQGSLTYVEVARFFTHMGSQSVLFSIDEIDDSEMLFDEMRPKIQHILPDIRLTIGEKLGKNPTSSGRPVTAGTQRNVTGIDAAILNDWWIQLRTLSQQFNISYGAVYDIAHDILKFHKERSQEKEKLTGQPSFTEQKLLQSTASIQKADSL
ncbi:hypothetical protein ANN_14501 [Periplaneta americana]|uniref:Uncharacterized protein n=1 Tax=Periplaneta americana TaxID=6978 RepID=A0ABQ8SWF5_PERAM|nr:hypothetical protein ANN_14501 [Periplaneta americana]